MKRRTKKRGETILLTCAGGSAPLYLAQLLTKRHTVVLADARKMHAGRFLGLPCEILPAGDHPSYPARLRSIVRKYGISVIVPGADEEIVPSLKVGKQEKVVVVAPQQTFAELCLDKKHLMEALAKEDISYLVPFRYRKDVTFPVIVKPVRGRGSRGVHTVNNVRELRGYLDLYGKTFRDVLVQPYAGGDEYTISVIVNGDNELIGVVPKKILVKRGITRSAVTERNRRIEDVCRKIVETWKPCGPFNVQLKLWKGKPYIFEINPRLSTTAVLTERAFGNEIELFIQARPIRRPRLKEGVMLIRYEENLFQ